jgi:hypothetical protein
VFGQDHQASDRPTLMGRWAAGLDYALDIGHEAHCGQVLANGTFPEKITTTASRRYWLGAR